MSPVFRSFLLLCFCAALLNYVSRVTWWLTLNFVPSADGILAFSAYTLAFTVPKLQDPIRQRLGVYVWTGISVVMYVLNGFVPGQRLTVVVLFRLGVLMNIFTMKQGACKSSLLYSMHVLPLIYCRYTRSFPVLLSGGRG